MSTIQNNYQVSICNHQGIAPGGCVIGKPNPQNTNQSLINKISQLAQSIAQGCCEHGKQSNLESTLNKLDNLADNIKDAAAKLDSNCPKERKSGKATLQEALGELKQLMNELSGNHPPPSQTPSEQIADAIDQLKEAIQQIKQHNSEEPDKAHQCGNTDQANNTPQQDAMNSLLKIIMQLIQLLEQMLNGNDNPAQQDSGQENPEPLPTGSSTPSVQNRDIPTM